MRKSVIHPTHRKVIRILRKRCEEGHPVVVRKEEVDILFKVLPTLGSPTMRNQSVYRLLLKAMNRSSSELKEHKDFYVLNDKSLEFVESIYSKIEKEHLCYTVLDSFKSFLIREEISRRKLKSKG